MIINSFKTADLQIAKQKIMAFNATGLLKKL